MAFDPITHPQDYIVLAGLRSPGIAEIVGASSPREWDERKGYGLSGSFSVFKGRRLARFAVRLRFYTEQDWLLWASWKQLVDKVPTKRGGSSDGSTNFDTGVLQIDHPILADLGIRAAAVEEVRQPEQTDHGEWTVEIKFIEFRHPVVTLAKPEGAKATPVDPYEQKIDALTKQFNDLAAQ